ncbi:chromosome partitioning protein ParB [Methylobacterium currus]|jgi:hypothetical protein|uniref:Chromosome partitioning protein ParB n=1 Tax=Methylobacterium currus TaxID=2051553 RepID=A0A2R4WQ26_9HYPH|nr:ParB N-terminal domain-containing protein [Methylobacterium currus]AWB23656.1 chromosome partitioning protein ParB [Methylobacterium currus]UHC16675.1 ParB/RepB/Spo0J family partition protein [Methylobacterium currus]
MKPISIEGLGCRCNPDPGPAPMLQWVNIAKLVVDTSYQRNITPRSRTNIARIAANFRWAYFAPVVISPIEQDRFAIIDGQHRTTAAALCGHDSVPCQIVIAGETEQAAAFKAINANRTPVTTGDLFVAAKAAGEIWAVELDYICSCADVRLSNQGPPSDKSSFVTTRAVMALRLCLKRYGRDTLITALQSVTQTSNIDPGLLNPRMIKALCEVIDRTPEWRDSGLALLDAFDHIDLAAIQRRVQRDASLSEQTERLCQAIQSALCFQMMPLAAE